MREGVDERVFFPEASGTVRGLHDSYSTPLTMTSSKGVGYSEFQYQSLADNPKQQHQEQQEQQHCFVLGTDFKSSSRPIKVERDDEAQKPLHHFFGEWPLKNRDSWLDLEEDPPPTHHHHGSFSTTQLSISIPMSSQKLLASDSRIETGTWDFTSDFWPSCPFFYICPFLAKSSSPTSSFVFFPLPPLCRWMSFSILGWSSDHGQKST